MELLKLFCKVDENIFGIHYSAKFMLAAKVCIWASLKHYDIDNYLFTQNMNCIGLQSELSSTREYLAVSTYINPYFNRRCYP